MKNMLYLILWGILLYAFSVLGDSILQTNAQLKKEQRVLEILQDTVSTAQQEANELLRKIERRDESKIVETLQKIRPTLVLANKAGEPIDISKKVSLQSGVYLKAVTDSILLARFPQDFQYQIKYTKFMMFGRGTAYEDIANSGKIICRRCKDDSLRWTQWRATITQCKLYRKERHGKLSPVVFANYPQFIGQ